jgi:hypothetical protein
MITMINKFAQDEATSALDTESEKVALLETFKAVLICYIKCFHF